EPDVPDEHIADLGRSAAGCGRQDVRATGREGLQCGLPPAVGPGRGGGPSRAKPDVDIGPGASLAPDSEGPVPLDDHVVAERGPEPDLGGLGGGGERQDQDEGCSRAVETRHRRPFRKRVSSGRGCGKRPRADWGRWIGAPSLATSPRAGGCLGFFSEGTVARGGTFSKRLGPRTSARSPTRTLRPYSGGTHGPPTWLQPGHGRAEKVRPRRSHSPMAWFTVANHSSLRHCTLPG